MRAHRAYARQGLRTNRSYTSSPVNVCGEGAVGGGSIYARSNTATALIIIPIAVSAANGMGISPRPVLMSVAVAAAFLTPVATPVNLMVKGPGGYHFGDYAKLGLPGGDVPRPGILAVLIVSGIH
jgi:Sodium:sulfate symporter transmembrane region